MSFKLPCLTLKAIIPKVTGLPSFNYNDLEEIGVVGHGSFGEEEVVVIKKLSDSDDNSDNQKEFVKEARMLYSVKN